MDDEYVGIGIVDYDEGTICDFLTYFAENTYSPKCKDLEPRAYLYNVIKLMERDYRVAQIPNLNGDMCFQYPVMIPIMESHRNVTTIYENKGVDNKTTYLDKIKTAELFDKAKYARCRQRFPVPVILYRGQNICRSSTLASIPEVCYRKGIKNFSFDTLVSMKEFLWPSEEMQQDAQEVHEPAPPDNAPQPVADLTGQDLCNAVRNDDISLLKFFNVSTIVDIMVEKRKVKHGLYVSASEKVDKERYSGFKLISLPYPGCEFFKDFHNAMFRPEGLKYNWSDPANDAVINVPNDNLFTILGIDWEEYREWDLVAITQNYIKYILKRLQEDNAGLLLHCISGWDRTPLFMTLIRMSLWADGLVHESLDEYEILYLTLTYDWYLFGHHLPNRLYKKEEIMAFCFDFLKYITGEEYSIKASRKKRDSDEKMGDESRSPSRSSNSSSVNVGANEGVVPKEKKRNSNSSSSNDFVMVETSNDSTTIEFGDVEDNISPHFDNYSNGANGDGNVEPIEVTISNSSSDGDRSVLTLPYVRPKRTSPVPIGNPGRRTRTDSTSSNVSNVSANWQMISECGSIEKDNFNLKPLRFQKLERVRTIFNACYQKTAKKDSYGPPKKWIVEEVVSGLIQWLELNRPDTQDESQKGSTDKTEDNSTSKNGNSEVDNSSGN